MTVDEEFKKWQDTRDLDYLFSATRQAIIVAMLKVKQIKQTMLEANRLYWEMKGNPSEKDKYNQEIDEIILPLESFIIDHIGYSGESYDDDSFKVPDFVEKRGKKRED